MARSITRRMRDIPASTSFTYKAYDGELYSSPATVTINVYASVGFQAEDYWLAAPPAPGSTVIEGSALGGQAITTNGNNTNGAGPPLEMVRYNVYFPNAGGSNTYHLYIRYRMGPGRQVTMTAAGRSTRLTAIRRRAATGTRSTTWSITATRPTAGSIWRRRPGSMAWPSYYNVSSGLHTWWFGGREDGMYLDAVVFSTGYGLDTTAEGQAILDAAVNNRPSAVNGWLFGQRGRQPQHRFAGRAVQRQRPEIRCADSVARGDDLQRRLDTKHERIVHLYADRQLLRRRTRSRTRQRPDGALDGSATVTITVNAVNECLRS